MVKDRIWFIDYAKIIGLYFVIFAHLYTSEGEGAENTIRTFFYGFHMPFFFAISGMLYKKRKEGLFFAIMKNVKSLFVPWLVFNIIFIVIRIINTEESIYDILRVFLRCVYRGWDTYCGASWFVICLFAVKSIYDILIYTNKKYLIYVLLAISIIPLEVRYLYFSSITIGLTFYYLGSISTPFLSKINCKKWQYVIIAILCFIASFLLTLKNGKVSVLAATINNPLIFYVNAIIGSIGILSIGHLLKRNKCKFVIKLSNSSICVVLTHLALVDTIIRLRKQIEINDIELFICYTILSCCIYILCYYLYVIFNKLAPWVFGRKNLSI